LAAVLDFTDSFSLLSAFSWFSEFDEVASTSLFFFPPDLIASLFSFCFYFFAFFPFNSSFTIAATSFFSDCFAFSSAAFLGLPFSIFYVFKNSLTTLASSSIVTFFVVLNSLFFMRSPLGLPSDFFSYCL